MTNSNLMEVRMLYQQLLDGWNNRDAGAMAELFTKEGQSIGFDGSQSIGKDEIYSHLKPIFEDHPTAPFVSKIKSVRFLHDHIALLQAIAGMIPPGKTDIEPKLNTHHTVVAVNKDGRWQIELFQNTPAQFHLRPELVEQMTEELRQVYRETVG